MSDFKIINAAQLDAAMAATADAIRAKTGDAGDIPWDDANGFSDAVGAIVPKTQVKTVTPEAESRTYIPDGDNVGFSQFTVEGDADLKAENIAQGVNIFGVLGTLYAAKVEIGSFIPESDSTTMVVNHSMGVVPTFAFYAVEKQYPVEAEEAFMGYAFTSGETFENLEFFYGGDINARIQNRTVVGEDYVAYQDIRPMTEPGRTGSAFSSATDTAITLKNTYPFKAGQRYIYILIGETL